MLLALQRLVSPPRPDLRILPRLIDKLDAVSLDDRPTSGQRGDSRSRRQSRFGGGAPLADRFTVPQQRGAGGWAVDARAHDRLPDLAEERTLRANSTTPEEHRRFERMIRRTARLVHPTILPLFDRGW